MYEIRITTETHPIHLQTALNSHKDSDYETFDYKQIDSEETDHTQNLGNIMSAKEARKISTMKYSDESYYYKLVNSAICDNRQFIGFIPHEYDIKQFYHNNPHLINHSGSISDYNVTKKDIHPNSPLNKFLDKGYSISYETWGRSSEGRNNVIFKIHW